MNPSEEVKGLALPSRKTAIVTGAGGGIGREVARSLARSGWDLALLDADEARLHQVSEELPEALCRVVDITNAGSVGNAASDIHDAMRSGHLGDASGIAHFAGVVGKSGFAETSWAEWDRTVAINLTGTFAVLKSFVPLMGSGSSVVLAASMAAQTSSLYASPSYAASKAGVIGLARSLAVPFAQDGIRINAVAPGAIDTPMLAEFGEDGKQTLAQRNPLGRLGTPADVAGTVDFLLSENSGFITGEVISVNGGSFVG